MGLLPRAGLILGAGLIASGGRAIRRRWASVPERYEGTTAVRIFLEAAN
jgi:hypothetical protein